MNMSNDKKEVKKEAPEKVNLNEVLPPKKEYPQPSVNADKKD